VAPDNKLLKSCCLADYESYLLKFGLREGRNGDFRIKSSPGDLEIMFRWGPLGKRSWSQHVYFLTGEAPKKIVAHTTSHAWIDEPGLMDAQVDKNVTKRMRCPNALYRQRLYTGTPEGTDGNWFYELFHPDKVIRQPGTPYSESERCLVLHGSSHDNPYLDQEYLDSLDEEFGWDKNYYANYVLGEWVSLSRNRFYHAFTNELIGDYPPDPQTKTLYLSFDNNVGCMTWAALQPWENQYLVVRDNGGNGRNIDDACEQFVDAFPVKDWGNHHIVVLGDAALWARSVHSNQRGYEIIRDNLKKYYPNLTLGAPRGNPFVEERSRNTNKLFAKRKLLVDRSAKKVIGSAQSAESDPKRGIKKPSGDQVTHAMEAVDMAMLVLEPLRIQREYVGIK
jgi:Phage terminase large subunit